MMTTTLGREALFHPCQTACCPERATLAVTVTYPFGQGPLRHLCQACRLTVEAETTALHDGSTVTVVDALWVQLEQALAATGPGADAGQVLAGLERAR